MGGWAGALADGATHVGHELLADRADVLGEGGGKHHHLLVVWRHFEDGLNVSPHVCSSTKIMSDSAEDGYMQVTEDPSAACHQYVHTGTKPCKQV